MLDVLDLQKVRHSYSASAFHADSRLFRPCRLCGRYHQTIHNCLIDEVCYASHYVNAITDAVEDFRDYENFLVGGHAITFNTMRNAGRHFFNFYGNGTSPASRTRGPMDYAATLLAHNHLYNGMLQTRDAGLLTGYYCSGGTLNAQNSQVLFNVVHDTYDPWGMEINNLGLIYLDAGTCDTVAVVDMTSARWRQAFRHRGGGDPCRLARHGRFPQCPPLDIRW